MGRTIGAEYKLNGMSRFQVWAPEARKVELVLKEKSEPIKMKRDPHGYWEAVAEKGPGTRYKFRIDEEKEFPDPASRSQPEGVHSWSEVTDPEAFIWSDQDRRSRRIGEMVIYEIHVGTFTPEGDFQGIIDKLDHLEELGINTLEIMPVAQFPGTRNWGYDGVYPFAVQDSYGGIEGLKKLVDTCHQRGFSVLLDVVYNHMGPEGNYLSQYGPYFTSRYHTPWGSALNFDDAHSDHVRNFFIQNALMWLDEFHFDGLRLDAIHEIIDRGARHFLKELSEKVDQLQTHTGRHYVIIAESDLNDTRVVREYSRGGYSLEGQWVDDFHHSVHTILTKEEDGYYADYGKMEYLAKSFRQAFVYDGMYSGFRKKSVGNSPTGLSPSNFVVCIQNHDQVGNRLLGERLSTLVSFEQQKLAAGFLLSSPFVPLLFMGEEFGETAPFRYFVSHTDPELVKAVQEGRKKEFEYFNHREGEFPDPQAQKTFDESKISWSLNDKPERRSLFKMYQKLLQLRKKGVFKPFTSPRMEVTFDQKAGIVHAVCEGEKEGLVGIFNFGNKNYKIPFHKKIREITFASADKAWGGEYQFEAAYSSELVVPTHSMVVFKI